MIKNYHKESIKYENKYAEELLVIYGILISMLNKVQRLTEKSIEDTIRLWKIEYAKEIEELNANYVNKLHEFSNRIVPTKEKFKQQETQVKKLTNANDDMLDVTTDFIKQKFTELSILERTYDYSSEQGNKFLEQIVNSTEDKIVLFATMSTINNLRELIFGNAESEGWTEYQWRTQRDSKVRPSHAAMDGKWIKFDDPSPQPAGYHVGEDYNCRCWSIDFR
jgi:SPP1 gp7 family putative phage head morphogenesis protein